jgi:Flp pilus assembly protein TadD
VEEVPMSGSTFESSYESSYDSFQRGRRYFALGDYRGAARILAPVAEAEPTNRALLELLGRAYFHSAQLRRAEATFRRLVELDPVDAWAHVALARALERQGRSDEAGRHRRLHAAMSGGSRD